MARIGNTVMGALVISLATAGAAAAWVPFGTATNIYSTLDGASSVAAADFNRDGYMDVVAAAIDGDEIRIRFGGDSPVSLILVAGFDRACMVRAADVNGDGWTDVVGAKRGTGTGEVRWWQNPGNDGGTWDQHQVSNGVFDEARGFDVGDIDGDGDADVVVAGVNPLGGVVYWFENMGTGFAGPWGVDNSLAGAHGALIADLNGDGHADVAAVGYDADEVRWYEGSGGGAFVEHSVRTNFDGAICIAAADMDSDGDLDLVAGAYLADDVMWFWNRIDQGLGWFGFTIEGDLDGVYSVQPVDLDRDGDLEVVASARQGDRVTCFEYGNASWNDHDLSTSFNGARSAVAVDFDGDGDLEVLAAAEFDDDVTWWENESIHITATFDDRAVVDEIFQQPTSVDVADLDQDGDLDVAGTVFNDTGHADVVYHINGGGAFIGFSVLEWTLDGAAKVRVTDINTDGIPDLVAVGSTSGLVRWYEGTGEGDFTAHTVASGFDGAMDVDTADLDCDGDIDVAAVAYLSGEARWWENTDGDGTSWTEHMVWDLSGPSAVRAADVDRDGDSDLVVADYAIGRLVLIENVGYCSGSFTTLRAIAYFDGPQDLAVDDLDDDGWPDIAAAASGESAVAVWLQRGPYWERHDVATGFDGVRAVCTADMDLDGDQDIVGAAWTAHDVRWWQNTNAGTAWRPNEPLDYSLLGASAVAVGDVTADGLPDVVAAGMANDTVAMYEGLGGQYLVSTADLAPEVIADGTSAPILGIVPTHGGRPTDLAMELRNVSLGFRDVSGSVLTSAQANAIIDHLQIWLDSNDDGQHQPADDDLVETVSTLNLDSGGFMNVSVSHGAPNQPIGHGDAWRYFVVVTTTVNASSQTPNTFRISHWNSSPVLCRYWDHQHIPLQPVPWGPHHGSTVTCVDQSLIFADGFESGDTVAWSHTTP